eukprot:Nk52_evm1s365 gene=Nk52_evmTU1s365
MPTSQNSRRHLHPRSAADEQENFDAGAREEDVERAEDMVEEIIESLHENSGDCSMANEPYLPAHEDYNDPHDPHDAEVLGRAFENVGSYVREKGEYSRCKRTEVESLQNSKVQIISRKTQS